MICMGRLIRGTALRSVMKLSIPSFFGWKTILYVVYRNKVGPKNLKGFFSASHENVCMVWWIFAVNPVLDRIASRRAKPHSAQAWNVCTVCRLRHPYACIWGVGPRLKDGVRHT